MRAATQSPLSMNGQTNTTETILYFSPSYSGEVHIILGNFVLETPGTVDEAIKISKRYQEAAKRCNKPIELVPTDYTYQTTGQSIENWIGAQSTHILM